MKKYGLKYKKENKILGYTVSSHDAEFSTGKCVELCHYQDNMWLVDSAAHAEYVRNNSVDWYNSSEDTPNNDYKPEELEVVEVVINTAPVVDVVLPDVYELIKAKAQERANYQSKYQNAKSTKTKEEITEIESLCLGLNESMKGCYDFNKHGFSWYYVSIYITNTQRKIEQKEHTK